MFSRRVTKPKHANHDRQRDGGNCYHHSHNAEEAGDAGQGHGCDKCGRHDGVAAQHMGTAAAATMGVRDTATVGATLAVPLA